ncbi:BA75_03155T0 [Komagataella pastoris]|uniref:BA75_03155T0 n=1 Tax=Komagataella pastoris TaxID=4922 RepID=A0A1B2JB76_PICPA|nr:BA75_03155T0 [Komagataella pastoris]
MVVDDAFHQQLEEIDRIILCNRYAQINRQYRKGQNVYYQKMLNQQKLYQGHSSPQVASFKPLSPELPSARASTGSGSTFAGPGQQRHVATSPLTPINTQQFPVVTNSSRPAETGMTGNDNLEGSSSNSSTLLGLNYKHSKGGYVDMNMDYGVSKNIWGSDTSVWG